jgi:hypothetical protein
MLVKLIFYPSLMMRHLLPPPYFGQNLISEVLLQFYIEASCQIVWNPAYIYGCTDAG